MSEQCEWCEGTGALDGEACNECGGTGWSGAGAAGGEEVGAVCDWCSGVGEIDGVPCDGCGGTGQTGSGGDWDMQDATVEAQAPATRRASFVFVDDNDISQRLQDLATKCAEQLAVSLDEASIILRFYFWDLDKAEQSWFENVAKAREKIGLAEPLPKSKIPAQVQCLTSMCDEVPSKDAKALGCGHWFCKSCWTQYLDAQIKLGPDCIFATCPGYNCKQKKCKHRLEDGCKCQHQIPESFFQTLASNAAEVGKFNKYMRGAFMSKNKIIKTCPRPLCQLAVESRSLRPDREIQCQCGHVYCFKCTLDAHLPVPCDLAHSFIALDQTDALTEALINAVTKPCPKCKVRIEKNEACIHMTCKNCRHEYCWLCKKAWQGHGGGYYSCAQYNKNKEKGEFDDEQKQLQQNQEMLQKYSLYKSEYDRHKKMNETLTKKLFEVETSKKVDASKSKFLVDSLHMLMAAHRLLQWSYCLTYYLKESSEKKLFLFQQKQLNDMAKEMDDYINPRGVEALCELDARQWVVNHSSMLEKHRKSSLEAIESGSLIEVILNKASNEDDQWGCVKCSTVNEKIATVCVKCAACKLHGEKQCWGCAPR